MCVAFPQNLNYTGWEGLLGGGGGEVRLIDA